MTDSAAPNDGGGVPSGPSEPSQSSPPSTSSRPRPSSRPGLAVVVAVAQIVSTLIFTSGRATKPDLFGYAVLAVSGLALAERYRNPAFATVIAAATIVAAQPLGYPYGVALPALCVAVVAAARADRHGLVFGIGVAAFTAWVFVVGATFGRGLATAAGLLGFLLVAEFVAYAGLGIKEMFDEQNRLQEERRRRRSTEERLRIATELHDVLGHHLSLINVRASVGRHLMDRDPEEARAALDTIKVASAEALREVRSVLDTLYPTGDPAPRAPALGLDRLDELTVDAGLPVRTTIHGDRRPLPAEVDRAAYRIVQEALTNVRRHAGFGAASTVVIEYRPDEVAVQVEDDGGLRAPGATAFAAGAASPEGNGITGMRERAAALGGTLTAERLHDGGWRIRALLPAPAPDPADPSLSPSPSPETDQAS